MNTVNHSGNPQPQRTKPFGLVPPLSSFSDKLGEILSGELSKSLQQSQQHLTHLFDTLIDEIATIQAKQTLSYDEDLYIKSIIYADFSGDSLPEEIAQRVEQIIECIADPTSCLKQRLFQQLLEPFLVEQTPESSLPLDRTVSLSEGVLHTMMAKRWSATSFQETSILGGLNQVIKNLTLPEIEELMTQIKHVKRFLGLFDHHTSYEQLQVIFRDPKMFRGLYLHGIDLDRIHIHHLDFIFRRLFGLRSLSFSGNHLPLLTEKQLESIFGHLGQLRALSIHLVGLGQLPISSLSIVFSSLKSLLYLNMQDTELLRMNQEQLSIIFQNLSSLKSINLTHTGIGSITDPSLLKLIFTPLAGVKYLHFDNNRLENLSQSNLELIFSSLKSVSYVDLKHNKLIDMSEGQLQALFGSLRSVREVDISNTTLERMTNSQLTIIFQHLKDVPVVRITSLDRYFLLSRFPFLEGRLY